MRISEDDLFKEMLEDPAFFGISVYRRNPCCYRDQVEVDGIGTVMREHYDDAEEAVIRLKALTRAVEALIDRFRETGDIETLMGACEGCEVKV